MVSNLRATAMMATFLGLPAAMRRSKKTLRTGLCRRATRAPMNRAVCTHAQPPPMKLLPRHWRDCRVKGARPTSAAMCLRPSLPSSGNSAMSVREITGPTLDTEQSRSTFSRQAGEPRTPSSISVSTFLALPFRADHLHDLTPTGDKIGKLLGCLIGQRPWCDAGRLSKVGNHPGIDRIRLGALADGFGEGADLRWVGDRDRLAGRREGRNDDGLEAAGGLEHDAVGP